MYMAVLQKPCCESRKPNLPNHPILYTFSSLSMLRNSYQCLYVAPLGLGILSDPRSDYFNPSRFIYYTLYLFTSLKYACPNRKPLGAPP